MTRCLDCGADRTADQCSACGLTSAAAELVLRRRLVRRTAFFLVGIILFVLASQEFPALELDAIMIFGGAVFFLSLRESLALRLGEAHLLVFGVLFIAVVLVFPGGFVEAVRHLLRRGFVSRMSNTTAREKEGVHPRVCR